MYHTMAEFQTDYAQLTEGTTRLLDLLTDRTLDQAVAPGHRTIGQLSWHLVTTVPEMVRRTGLPLSSLDPHAPPPAAAVTIATAYRTVTKELTETLAEHWTDADLATEDEMYGQRWPRGLTLTALVHHEIHHRGQLTVLMRQAGIRVPGLYGPAQEEWGEYGMEAPPY